MPFTRAYPFFEFFVHKLTERTILYITMDAKDTLSAGHYRFATVSSDEYRYAYKQESSLQPPSTNSKRLFPIIFQSARVVIAVSKEIPDTASKRSSITNVPSPARL